MLNIDIDKLNNFYNEGNLFVKMNPQLSKLIYDVIECKNEKLSKQSENTNGKTSLPILSQSKPTDTTIPSSVSNPSNTTTEVLPTDPFVLSINKIDAFINSLDYNLIIKKPDFIFDFDSPSIQNYINGGSDIIYLSKSNTQDDEFLIDAVRDNKISTNQFAQKKLFMDISTEFVSRNAVYTDDRQELIFKFQYLVNMTINRILAQYKQKNNIDPQDIYFIYKGGTFMKIMFEKYNKIFTHNVEFMDLNKEYFKRSDSDYTIYISPKFNIKDYTFHYYNLNIIIYNLLQKIQNYIDNNLNDILPIDEITDAQLSDLLKQMNTQLLNSREVLNESGKNYFVNIEKFVGMSLYNKTYMAEDIPDNFKYFKLKSLDSKVNKTDVDYASSNPLSREYQFTHNKKISVERNDFYITFTESGGRIFTAIENISNPPKSSGIYQYYNETNLFKSVQTDIKSYFTLHRVKVNIILYAKTYNNEYGYFLCPSELIDVPIPTFSDYKKNIDFSTSLKTIVSTIKNKELIFDSYTLYGLIHDLYLALFEEGSYPWDDKKYLKKIHRYSFFLTLYLNNKYTNFPEIQKNIIDYLNNPSTPKLTNFVGSDSKISATDELYNDFYNGLERVRNTVNTNSNTENRTELVNMIETIKRTIDIFNYEPNNPEFNNKVENVPYLKKYLKYKQKYLSLKNKN